MIKYCLKILIIGLLFFALTSIIMNTLGINLNIEEQPKKLIRVITMEAFQKQEKEKQKDSAELLADKRKFIEEIRKFRKSDLTNSDEIKLTLWQKIKKTLGF